MKAFPEWTLKRFHLQCTITIGGTSNCFTIQIFPTKSGLFKWEQIEEGWQQLMQVWYSQCPWVEVASSPGHSQILSRSHGINLGVAWGRGYRVEVYALFLIIPTLFAYLRFSAYLYFHLRFTSALLQEQYRQMHYLYHIRWFSISCITVSSFCYIFYPPMNTCLCIRRLNFLQSCVHFDLGHITIHMHDSDISDPRIFYFNDVACQPLIKCISNSVCNVSGVSFTIVN